MLEQQPLSRKTLLRYMQQVTPHLTGRRYCTACATERDAGDFIKVIRGKTTRWLCGPCQRKESESWINRGKK